LCRSITLLEVYNVIREILGKRTTTKNMLELESLEN